MLSKQNVYEKINDQQNIIKHQVVKRIKNINNCCIRKNQMTCVAERYIQLVLELEENHKNEANIMGATTNCNINHVTDAIRGELEVVAVGQLIAIVNQHEN